MFTLKAPQWAINSDGYEVIVANRETMEYRDADLIATVAVDFGDIVTLFSKFVAVVSVNDRDTLDRDLILDRVKKGLEAMGSRVTIQAP